MIENYAPLWMGTPFVLLLLAISTAPVFFPYVWHRIENIFLVIVSAFSLLFLSIATSANYSFSTFLDILTAEYIPFICAVGAVYTISTSLRINLSGQSSPLKNVFLLFIGAVLSNFIGTTGASMLLIHPFLRWNRHQKYQTHLVVFFIFIVSNVGGCLTPLGDAPLLVGYLQGIPFTWPMLNLWKPCGLAVSLLLIIFLIIDLYKNRTPIKHAEHVPFKIDIEGKYQLFFAPLIMLSFLYIDNAKTFPFLREITLILICFSSYILDRKRHKFLGHHGHWAPISEVARVFLAIFICIAPLSLMLSQGDAGAFSSILKLTNTNGQPNPSIYYWMAGSFSGFLDNAPTYLLFFKMIGGDASHILLNHNTTLQALSVGTIFFGALTYIGNAPNFMVRNIAKQHAIQMPSFAAYMGWAIVFLLPVLWLVQFLLY